MGKKKLKGRIEGGAGLVTLFISELMLFHGVEPFASWFYCFAWWAYILIADSIIYEIKGDSLVISRTREFLWLIPWSVVLWLLFELVNIIMKNWYYANVIDYLPARWIGYALAYSTVLPGIFETAELLAVLGLFSQRGKRRKIVLMKKWLVISCMGGVLFLITSLIFPRYCFPFIWLSFVFLLEPVNYWLGGKSLLQELEKGDWQKIYILLTAGMICGLLWEFWNYWARTKWIYTVPFFQDVKLFEMPALGYLGFPPFAVECYVFYNLICLMQGREGWERGEAVLMKKKTWRYPAQIALLTLMFFFSLVSFKMIDTYTVKSFSRMGNSRNIFTLKNDAPHQECTKAPC
jgi:hypothetical protein